MRTVLISPSALGCLGAWGYAINLLDQLPRVDTYGIFYSLLFQTGATHFELFKDVDHHLSLHEEDSLQKPSEFLEMHSTTLPDKIYNDAVEIVRSSFERFLPDDYTKHDKRIEIATLMSFFVNLAIAVDRKIGLVVSSLPKLGKLKGILPAELFYPIQNFLGAIENESTETPIPRSVISASDFSRLQEVLTSDLFSLYANEHSHLEDATYPIEGAVRRVSKGGLKLVKCHVDLLKLKNLALSLIPVTTSIVDQVFGAIPGKIAEFFGDHLLALLKSERRVIIYHYNYIFQEIFKERLDLAFPGRQREKNPEN